MFDEVLGPLSIGCESSWLHTAYESALGLALHEPFIALQLEASNP